MEPLPKWSVFIRFLDHFLGDNTSPEGAARRYLGFCIMGNIENEFFINLLDFYLSFNLYFLFKACQVVID
jgi:hypothetical protein